MMSFCPISDTANGSKCSISEFHGINKPSNVDFSVISFVIRPGSVG